MTFDAAKRRNDATVDQPSHDRCMRYLFGELASTDAAAFEQELSQSTELNEELLRQADLLCHLSASINQPEFEPVLVGQHRSHLPLLVAIAALAACVAIIVGSFRAPDPDQSIAHASRGVSEMTVPETSLPETRLSEASLIAQAWATGQIDGVLVGDDFAAHDFEYEFVGKAEDVVSADSAFSWMVHAIAADPDSPTEAATSDG